MTKIWLKLQLHFSQKTTTKTKLKSAVKINTAQRKPRGFSVPFGTGPYSALCCETKWLNLTIAILDFGIRLYCGSELSKLLAKCFLQMRTKSEFFYNGWKCGCSCVKVIDITWGRIYLAKISDKIFGLKVITHRVNFLHAFFYFFRIPHPFLTKCVLRKQKLRKSNLIRIYFHGRKFQTLCAMTFSLQWP